MEVVSNEPSPSSSLVTDNNVMINLRSPTFFCLMMCTKGPKTFGIPSRVKPKQVFETLHGSPHTCRVTKFLISLILLTRYGLVHDCDILDKLTKNISICCVVMEDEGESIHSPYSCTNHLTIDIVRLWWCRSGES